MIHCGYRNFVQDDANDGEQIEDRGRPSKRRRSAERDRRRDPGRSERRRERDGDRHRHSHREHENDRRVGTAPHAS